MLDQYLMKTKCFFQDFPINFIVKNMNNNITKIKMI